MKRAPLAVRSVVVALAWTFALVVLGVLAARFEVVIDATSTREHRLSAKTRQVLDGLKDAHEVVIVYSASASDPVAARRTLDVLDSIDRASDEVTVSTIDLSASGAAGRLDAVLTRLMSAFSADIARVDAGVQDAVARCEALSADLPGLSERLVSAGRAIPAGDAAAGLKKFFDDAGAVARLVGRDLATAAESARATARQRVAGTPVPALDAAASGLRGVIGDLTRQLEGVHTGLETVAARRAGAVNAETLARVRELVPAAQAARERLAAVRGVLDDLPRPAILAAARTLERSSAALVVRAGGASGAAAGGGGGAAPAGLTGLDLEALFPARTGAGDTVLRPDTRARTEDLVTAALIQLSGRARPIVVLTHGTNVKLGPEFRLFGGLVQRLKLSGIDVVEWAVAVDAEPPTLTPINPGGTRPVVYAVLPAAADSPETAQRMLKLAGVLRDLTARGESLLVSLNPSTLPSIGQADPLSEFLEPLGVDADTARPLLRRVATQTGTLVGAEFAIIDPLSGAAGGNGDAASPVARSIRGLRTDLLWCIPLRVREVSGVTTRPVVVIDNQGGAAWAESQWSEFRRVPVNERAGVVNPPGPDSARDDRDGPWTVAASVDRAGARVGGGAQRVMIVGSNGWFFDEIAGASGMVEGRPTLVAPGNAELFEASVHWLAGQEDLIASGATAAPTALIPPMSDAGLRALRWGLVVGVPLLVLLAGAIWRLIRG